MTRKFTIALVNAPRILQMLVTVVLVGKNFATTIARVPIFVCYKEIKLSIFFNFKDKQKQKQTKGPLTLTRLLAHLVRHVLERDGYAQKLQITIAIPDEQLLSLRNVLAYFIVNFALALHGYQILLLSKSSTIHIDHPLVRL